MLTVMCLSVYMLEMDNKILRQKSDNGQEHVLDHIISPSFLPCLNIVAFVSCSIVGHIY